MSQAQLLSNETDETLSSLTHQLLNLHNFTSNSRNASQLYLNGTYPSPSTSIANANSSHNLLNIPVQNYSVLFNKLEQLAVNLDTAFANLSVEHNELEIALTNDNVEESFILGAPIAAGRAPPPHAPHHGGDVEVEHVVSDIWIGVILTLLIVSVIFFICSCFLYHKFQQWKNSYRTSRSEPVEICRHFPADFEAESLPSYTIVSGLPTYDDALEEFRKAGIILAPQLVPIIKIFESDSKESQLLNLDQDSVPSSHNITMDGDNVSQHSNCICGLSPNSANLNNTLHSSLSSLSPATQIIELTPEQLAALSQKRLSLQIAFGTPHAARRNSRQRIDMRNRLLRSMAGTSVLVHQPRRSSVGSINLVDCANQQMHHRGSLC